NEKDIYQICNHYDKDSGLRYHEITKVLFSKQKNEDTNEDFLNFYLEKP
ncbi:18756_t:CDS:1, partial [Dentiscutata erythropus]